MTHPNTTDGLGQMLTLIGCYHKRMNAGFAKDINTLLYFMIDNFRRKTKDWWKSQMKTF